jgi:hypothetical protein
MVWPIKRRWMPSVLDHVMRLNCGKSMQWRSVEERRFSAASGCHHPAPSGAACISSGRKSGVSPQKGTVSRRDVRTLCAPHTVCRSISPFTAGDENHVLRVERGNPDVTARRAKCVRFWLKECKDVMGLSVPKDNLQIRSIVRVGSVGIRAEIGKFYLEMPSASGLAVPNEI